MNNVFGSLLETIREEGKAYNPLTPMLGEIISPLPNLKLKINSMELYKDDLMISKWLLDRNNINYFNNCSEHGDETITFEPKLENRLCPGDLVLLIPLNNGEKFIIVEKVVNL